jgi:hypothetical protein
MIGLYYPQLHMSDLLVTYPAIFADEYMVLHTWQFMWPFANVCRCCEGHIYGVPYDKEIAHILIHLYI